MNILDFKKGYEKYARATMFLAESSEQQRDRAARYLCDFMERRQSEDITVEVMMEFRNSLKGYKPSTINLYLRNLRTIFNWLLEMGYWSGGNPVRPMLFLQTHERQIKSFLGEEDMFRLSGNDVCRDERDIRRRAITLTLVTSGLRESELCGVRPCDLDWERGTIYIPSGKGDKDRTVLFYQTAQTAVKRYMKEVRPKDAADTDPLFMSPTEGRGRRSAGKGLTRRTIQNDVHAYIEHITGRSDISPHCLRHTFARQMLSNGVPLAEIQQMLGHSNYAITEHYAKLIAPDTAPLKSAAAVFDRMHPDDNFFPSEKEYPRDAI